MQENYNPIFADFRENRSKVPGFLIELGVKVEGASLAADYVISRGCEVERKTVADFITSIADGRLFRQVSDMAYHCSSPLILVEGGGLYRHSRVTENIIRGAILWITMQKKVALIRTCNEWDTACTLALLVKKYSNMQNVGGVSLRHRRVSVSPWQRQIRMLKQIPGLGHRLAHDLLTVFGSVAKLQQAPDIEFMSVPGLGKGRLQSIRQFFPRPVVKNEQSIGQ